MRDLRVRWHIPLTKADNCALKCSLLATTLVAIRDQLVAGLLFGGLPSSETLARSEC